MINKKKLYWAHRGELIECIVFYIIILLFVLSFSLGFSYFAHSKDIDAGVQDAVRTALLNGVKWFAIIMPIVTVLFAIRFIWLTDRVEFSDDSMSYYRWAFSKKCRIISYDEITKCVFSDGLFCHQRGYERGTKIIFCNKIGIILELGLYPELCLCIALTFNDNKVWLVNKRDNLKSIDTYYKINFKELTHKQQIEILKNYCKHKKYKTGEEIIKSKKTLG